MVILHRYGFARRPWQPARGERDQMHSTTQSWALSLDRASPLLGARGSAGGKSGIPQHCSFAVREVNPTGCLMRAGMGTPPPLTSRPATRD